MESKEEKSKRYHDYLSLKREEFVQKLIRIGAKLVCLNNGDYDLDSFLKTFVPSNNFLKNKIKAEVKESQTKLLQESPLKDNLKHDTGCVDSQLIDALKAEFTKFEKDFQELLTVTDEANCASSSSTVTQTLKLPGREKKPKCIKKIQKDVKINRDAHCINQILNPGEMSKIFVQKAGADIVSSKMCSEPNFDDDNLETIYIYRSKNC